MSSPEARAPRGGQVRVWDRFVRCFHWGLVASFGTAWWFTEHIGWLHKGAGYLALALVTARVVWASSAATTRVLRRSSRARAGSWPTSPPWRVVASRATSATTRPGR